MTRYSRRVSKKNSEVPSHAMAVHRLTCEASAAAAAVAASVAGVGQR